MAQMPTPRTDILPPPSRLDATVDALEARGDLRNLIRFVERWQELGEASNQARMAQARAFMRLRLMDKATIRLERLAETDGFERDALVLLARCFRLRGWPRKANAALQKALAVAPDDDEVMGMLEATTRDPIDFDEDDEKTGNPEKLVLVAEHHIATGAFLKAQSLIERARRIRPNNPHAADLLWGMAGDYQTQEAMGDLVAKWGPEVTFSDLPDDPDFTEHTESFTLSEADLGEPQSESKAFPTLFKGLDPVTESYTGDIDLETENDIFDEKTQTAAVADLDELANFPDASPEAPTTVADSEDTQIAMVIRPSGPGAELTDIGARGAGPPVDLDAHRPANPASDFDPGLEEEDDDLIILTGKERTTGEPAPKRTPAYPLELDPMTSDVSGKVAEILEAVQRDRAREAQQEPATLALDPTPPAAPTRRRKRRAPARFSPTWWLFAIGAVLFATAMLIFALAGLQLLLG